MKPLSKEERAKLVEFLGDGTNDRCFLNQWWAQRVIADGAYWREAVKNSHPVETYNGFGDERCSWCGRALSCQDELYWRKPDAHKPNCPWLIAQGE